MNGANLDGERRERMGKEKSPGGLERKEVAHCLSLLLSEGDFIAALQL